MYLPQEGAAYMETSVQAFEKALRELYDALPEILSNIVYEQEKSSKPPSPLNQQHISHELSHDMLTLKQNCSHGLKNILEQLASHPETAADGKEVDEVLKKHFQSVLTPATFSCVILRVVAGDSWLEALKIDPLILEILYRGARELFEAGNFEKATPSFTFLSWLDARQYDFWMALGHCHFHTDAYTAAVSSYGIASYCLPDESWPYIYSAACFESMGDIEQQNMYLTEGLDRARKKSPHDPGLVRTIEQKLETSKRGYSTPFA